MISETVRNAPHRLAAFEPADSFPRSAFDAAQAHENRFASMLALAPAELERALRREIAAEHELPDAIRYPAALERLRDWLALGGEDARALARAYEAALATFPREYAARRRETESAVMLNGMTFAEFRALTEILPWPDEDGALDVFAAALGDAGVHDSGSSPLESPHAARACAPAGATAA